MSTLTSGICIIYYSDNNSTWTQWGSVRQLGNGGITKSGNQIFINGDGASGQSHRYWKFLVTITFNDGNTIPLSELAATEV